MRASPMLWPDRVSAAGSGPFLPAGAQAPRAYPQPALPAVHFQPDPLQVRLEAPQILDVGMADGMTRRRALAAEITTLGHPRIHTLHAGTQRLRTRAIPIRGAPQPAGD